MRGNLYIVSAPSGSGKTTLLQHLLRSFKDLNFSVSHTTRRPRQGERDGVDYFFTEKGAFSRMAERGDFLEWATQVIDELLAGFGESHAPRRPADKRNTSKALDFGNALTDRSLAHIQPFGGLRETALLGHYGQPVKVRPDLVDFLLFHDRMT